MAVFREALGQGWGASGHLREVSTGCRQLSPVTPASRRGDARHPTLADAGKRKPAFERKESTMMRSIRQGIPRIIGASCLAAALAGGVGATSAAAAPQTPPTAPSAVCNRFQPQFCNGNVLQQGAQTGRGNGNVLQQGAQTGRGNGNVLQQGAQTGRGNGNVLQQGAQTGRGNGNVLQQGAQTGGNGNVLQQGAQTGGNGNVLQQGAQTGR
ncbi:hypothetical protein ACWGLJ_43055, partial [Streptomyces sp. NPDC055898]